MDSNEAQQVKDKLLADKERIVKQLEEMTQEKSFNKDKVQTKWQDVGDKDEDNAIEVADFQDSISLERSLEENLEHIEKALSQIDKGTYGVCETCSNAIEADRLIALPQATRCMSCSAKK